MTLPHQGLVTVALAVASLAGSRAQADTITLAPLADNTMFFDGVPTSSLSNGVGDGIFVGRTASRAALAHRGLIRFDLAAIPAGSTINSVTLRMTVTRVPRTAFTSPIALHRLTASWGEGTSIAFGGTGASSDPGDANWLQRFSPGVPWTTPGGDFANAASATAMTPLEPGPLQWLSTPALVSDAQGWLANPASNFGWLLLGDEVSESSTRKLGSRESFAAEDRPLLTIIFTPPLPCDTIDFNADGLFPDDTDLVDFLNVLAGGSCSTGTCNDIDFNNDGLFPDDTDLVSFLNVLAGASC